MTRVKAGGEFPTENPVILKKVQDKTNRRGWGMFLINANHHRLLWSVAE
ncbi:hypothetical protein QUF90_26070 [Desulfococcaceae bacterium HSG9]|nr:hypothetical protein [Desulfococcaceae bacterium HSG9]